MGDSQARVAVAVLLAEMKSDREAMQRHCETLRDALASAPWAAGAPVLSVVAVAVHHFYGAAESLFERVARAFEGPPPRSERWHQELLERMAIAVAGMRPALLRRETSHALAPVSGFRHFFRHAYAVAFDARRLALTAEDAQRAHVLLAADLDAFEETLAEAGG